MAADSKGALIHPSGAQRLLRPAGMVAVAGAFLALMVAGTAALHRQASADGVPTSTMPLPVVTLEVQRESGFDILERFAGRLEPARQTRLAFELEGRVTRMLVDEGDHVEAGQVLARLDTARLQAERERLLARRAELEARLQLAKLTLQRVARLRDAGHLASEQHDEARLGVDELIAGRASVEAGLQRLQVDIDKSRLSAPFAGVVAGRLLDEGAVVAPGAPVLELLERAGQKARVGVSLAAAGALSPGQKHKLRIAGREHAAEVLALRPDLVSSTQTVTAIFRLAAGTSPGLRFGEVVELNLRRRIPEDGFWVPLTALDEGMRGLWSVLRVVGSETEAATHREAVEVLHTAGGRAYVRADLGRSARLVLDGTHRLIPGQAVALIEPRG